MSYFDDSMNTIDALMARRNQLFSEINREFTVRKAVIEDAGREVRKLSKIQELSLPKIVKNTPQLIWSRKSGIQTMIEITDQGISM
jgi:hypothetical protein